MVKWLRALGQSGTARVHLALIFFEAQLEELEKRVDGGEKIPQAADLAKRAVERVDGFVGVDDFADLRGKVEEGGELVPVGLPAAADGEVLGIVVARKASSALRAACSVGALFQHVLEKYPDQGASVYAVAG